MRLSTGLGLRLKTKQFLARARLGTITAIETPDPVAALTFDDGPNPRCTPQLLEVLRQHDARATFFMVGQFARQYPRLVQDVAEAGHAIGNHSWSHLSFPRLTAEDRGRQIWACAQALRPYGRRLFRFPYGLQERESRLHLWWLRYKVVGWSIDTEDWHACDAVQIVDRVLDGLRPGSIVICHDGAVDGGRAHKIDRRQTLEAIRILLCRLDGRFRFVTIPQLLRRGRTIQRILVR